MDHGPVLTPAALRAPRAAAAAGILFSLLLAAALVLIRLSVPSEATEAGAWLTDGTRRAAVTVALNLVPFAGIAFLWFIGVVRDRIGQHEDRFFATVFLGSGLLFIAMLFVAAAVAGGVLADPAIEAGHTPSPDQWALGRRITFTVLNIYAMRMGAVFILSTTTIALRTRIIPRWLGIAGYAVAVTLLFGVGLTAWVSLLLPAWVLILSVYILSTSLRAGRETGSGRDTRRAAMSGTEPGSH